MRILKINKNNVNEFNKLMSNRNQKIVCKVWASWCGHCKDLNKIWPKVEKAIKKEKGDGLLVSIEEKMIPYVSCIDSSEIPGYPWIFSMKGGDGKKKEYEGNRDYESLVKYIKKKLSKNNSKTMKKGGGKRRKRRKKSRKRRKLNK